MKNKIKGIILCFLLLKSSLIFGAEENFTTYTVVDPNTKLTITASKIDANAVSRNETLYCYSDKGSAYFGSTFTHLFKITAYSGGAAWNEVGSWAVSNTVADLYSWDTNNNQVIDFWYYSNGTDYPVYTFRNEESSTSDVRNLSWNTSYWLTITRTSDTAIKCDIYTDSGRTNLDFTLNLTITTGRTYRYIFACVSYNDNSVNTSYEDVENLDLGIAPPAATPMQVIYIN